MLKLPHKFINNDFAEFLSFLFPFEESEKEETQRAITGAGSVRELANDYQLVILHSLDLGDILKLLAGKGTLRYTKNRITSLTIFRTLNT